jgi:hypothetical protein
MGNRSATAGYIAVRSAPECLERVLGEGAWRGCLERVLGEGCLERVLGDHIDVIYHPRDANVREDAM